MRSLLLTLVAAILMGCSTAGVSTEKPAAGPTPRAKLTPVGSVGGWWGGSIRRPARSALHYAGAPRRRAGRSLGARERLNAVPASQTRCQRMPVSYRRSSWLGAPSETVTGVAAGALMNPWTTWGTIL